MSNRVENWQAELTGYATRSTNTQQVFTGDSPTISGSGMTGQDNTSWPSLLTHNVHVSKRDNIWDTLSYVINHSRKWISSFINDNTQTGQEYASVSDHACTHYPTMEFCASEPVYTILDTLPSCRGYVSVSRRVHKTWKCLHCSTVTEYLHMGSRYATSRTFRAG